MGISLGLVGLGSFGSSFAPLFSAHPLVDRTALCDAAGEKITDVLKDPIVARKVNDRDVSENYEDILKTDVDAIVLITQPWLHAPQALQAMESGKDVYSAVPILSVPDGDEILDWCDKLVNASLSTGKHFMLGETTYYHADTVHARKLAEQGAFGHFIHAEGDYWHSFDWAPADLRKVSKHRTTGKIGEQAAAMMQKYLDKGLRSGPMHYPTHSTCGPICVMKAHATKVSCIGMTPTSQDPYFQSPGSEIFSNETGFFKMSNGASMRICEYRDCGQSGREGFRIFGTDAYFYEDNLVQKGEKNDVWTHFEKHEMRPNLPDDVHNALLEIDKDGGAYGGHGRSHAYLVHEFTSSVAEDRHAETNIWEAARYMAPGVIAHKSALKDAEWLDVPDWGDAPQ
jgi:predicted dehydrogenase